MMILYSHCSQFDILGSSLKKLSLWKTLFFPLTCLNKSLSLRHLQRAFMIFFSSYFCRNPRVVRLCIIYKGWLGAQERVFSWPCSVNPPHRRLNKHESNWSQATSVSLHARKILLTRDAFVLWKCACVSPCASVCVCLRALVCFIHYHVSQGVWITN